MANLPATQSRCATPALSRWTMHSRSAQPNRGGDQMNGNESIYGDPAFEAGLLSLTDRNNARAARLRKQPLISTPTHGVGIPQPGAFGQGQCEPQDVGLEPSPNRSAPTPDYRAQSLKLLEQAAAAGEPTEEERQEGNRKLVLALSMGMKGGETMQPFAAQFFRQALADPEIRAQQRQQRLETQARLYESMAQHAESVEQRREAAKAAEATRIEIANLQGQTRRDIERSQS